MYGSGLLRWYMRRMNLSAEYSSMIRLIAGSAFAQGGHHVPVNTSTTVLFADVPVARGSGPFAVVPRSARFPPAMGKAIIIDPTTSNTTTIPTETATPDFWRMVFPSLGHPVLQRLPSAHSPTVGERDGHSNPDSYHCESNHKRCGGSLRWHRGDCDGPAGAVIRLRELRNLVSGVNDNRDQPRPLGGGPHGRHVRPRTDREPRDGHVVGEP